MSTNDLTPTEQARYNALLEMLPEMFPNGYPPPAAPEETRVAQPGSPARAGFARDGVEAPSAVVSEPSQAASAPADPVVDNELIFDIARYIGTYLQCSDHQRTILAFWVLHTYCFYAQDVTAYLSLQSAQSQAGKTRCLQLLNFLLHKPSLTCGLTVRTLFHRMRLNRPSGILLDECQATFGTRSRPKAPILRALLATNAHIQHGYMGLKQDVDAWVPKAFAGRGPLPEELAELCLPIILEPLRVAQPGSPARAGFARDGVEASSAVRRAVKKLTEQACLEAQPLADRLMAWSQSYLCQRDKERKALCNCEPKEFPASLNHLSYRRQDIIEPLLELAERLGDEWPQRLEQALVAIFEDEARFHLQPSLDILNALYACFCFYGFAERITTATVLEWLRMQDKRPWENDGPMAAQKLAKLLAMLEIRPRLQRMKDGTVNPARGYLLEDLRESWKKHFGYEFLPAEVLHPKSEIINKDAACNGLVQAARTIVSAQENSTDHRSQEAGFAVDLQSPGSKITQIAR